MKIGFAEGYFVRDENGEWWHRFTDGRRIRGKEFHCAFCNKKFINWRKTNFCSDECKRISIWGEKETITCKGCNREFFPNKSAQEFCSHTCAATEMHAQKPITTKRSRNDPINANNPRYSQDDRGQWWYQPGGPKKHGRTRASIKPCGYCGKSFLTSIFHRKKQFYCSKSCGLKAVCEANPGRYKGEKSTSWKGGRMIDRRGYAMLWSPDHPAVKNVVGKNYVFEHRLIMEKILGRYLLSNENVHHKDGRRAHHAEENLELWYKPQPTGQRVDDILKYAVKYHRETLIKMLGAHEQQHCPTCSCFH